MILNLHRHVAAAVAAAAAAAVAVVQVQHPRKTGQFIRKYHKLLQNLFQ